MIAALRALPKMIWARRSLAIWFSIYIHHSPNTILAWIGERIYVLIRYLHGARHIEVSAYKDVAGEYSAEGVYVSFGGACPVQGEGTVDGRECYYRSRGEGWQFHVAGPGSEDVFGPDSWEYSERPYIWPEGGWVGADRSRECIARGVAEFRKAGAS